MPPRAVRDRFPALSPDEVALLRAWIDRGTEWPRGCRSLSQRLSPDFPDESLIVAPDLREAPWFSWGFARFLPT